MIDVTIYGKPSYTFEYYKSLLKETANSANLQINVTEILDTPSFLENDLKKIPAFRIEDEVLYNEGNNLSLFINELKHWLLSKESFGSMRKFIVPVDFSDASNQAVEYAMHLAKEKNAILNLVHIYRPVAADLSMYQSGIDEVEEIKRNRLDQYTKNLSSDLAFNDSSIICNSEFYTGYPAEKLIELSKEIEGAVIIMGSKGSGGSMKNYFGSVSTKVASDAYCPVIIVPPQVKINGTGRVAMLVRDFLDDCNSLKKMKDDIGFQPSQIRFVNHGFHAYPEEEIIDYAKRIFPSCQFRNDRIDGNDIIKDVNKYCEENEIDILAMYKSHQGILEKLFHVSVTKRMKMNTKIPLVILHDKA